MGSRLRPAPHRQGRVAVLAPLTLATVLGAYSQLGPAGWLIRPLPDIQIPALPAASTAEWESAFQAAGLPAWPLEPTPEEEPLRIAVERTRPWTQEADGEALGRVAQQLFAMGLDAAAGSYAALAVELGTDKASWFYWKGVIAHGRHEDGVAGAFETAVAALKRAAELDPGYGVTHARLGDLFLGQNRLDEADAAYLKASQNAPAESIGLRGRAEIALRRGEASEALRLIDASIAKVPGDFRSHRVRAQALSALGRSDESSAAEATAGRLPVYSGWTTFDPRLAEAIGESATSQSLEMKLGVALQVGDLTAAADAGERLLKSRPRSISLLSSLASIYANRGNTTRALEHSTQAVEIDPSNVDALSLHCEVAINAKATEVIESSTKTLLDLDRRRAASWSLRARGQFVLGRIEEATQAMERAITLEPRVAAHPLLLSQMLERASDRDRAVVVLEDALRRMPSDASLAE
ncbi:MAG: tetratricopeptide repeat protein, partial [Planctomycetota bacterium]